MVVRGVHDAQEGREGRDKGGFACRAVGTETWCPLYASWGILLYAERRARGRQYVHGPKKAICGKPFSIFTM